MPTRPVIGVIEEMLTAAVFYENYLGSDDEEREELERKWDEKAGHFERRHGIDVTQPEAAFYALNLVVNDYRASGLAMEDYMRQCRRIHITPQKTEYIYIAPLRFVTLAPYPDSGIESAAVSYLPMESFPGEFLEIGTPMKKIDLIGLRFPSWGIGCKTRGEPVTGMFWNLAEHIREEGEPIGETDDFLIGDRVYHIEDDSKDMKGVLCFMGSKEEAVEFIAEQNGFKFPNLGYTEQQIDTDIVILGELENRYRRLGDPWAEDNIMSGLEIQNEMEAKYGYSEFRQSVARLATFGFMDDNLIPTTLRRTDDPKARKPFVDKGFDARKLITDITSKANPKLLDEMFFRSYLAFEAIEMDF